MKFDVIPHFVVFSAGRVFIDKNVIERLIYRGIMLLFL
ncbi:hypothetical protein KKH3_36660 [Pectobacterium actinidiae]|nr:hypothetical protein KKH3_36660 [Pectobacterium actinidiae]